jgi:DNA/RNA endonuclease YhcR with UshA esterase domain
MKRLISVLVLIVLLCAMVTAMTGCESNKPREYESYGSIYGDTYCKKCKKYTEGEVRICPYCGQYV